MNGATGSWNFTFSIAGRSRSAARATRGEWNAPETLSLTARRAPSILRLLDALVDGEMLARDDDLPGAVVVRGPDSEDLAAETLDHVVGEAEDGRHRAGIARRGLGHCQAALAHERHRLLQGHRLGRRQRSELADRVADHEVRLDPAILECREHRQGGRDERGLLHGRVDQFLGIGVEAEALQIEPGRRAPALEDVHRGRHRLREVAAHAGLDRSLAREAEGDLVHAGDPSRP